MYKSVQIDFEKYFNVKLHEKNWSFLQASAFIFKTTVFFLSTLPDGYPTSHLNKFYWNIFSNFILGELFKKYVGSNWGKRHHSRFEFTKNPLDISHFVNHEIPNRLCSEFAHARFYETVELVIRGMPVSPVFRFQPVQPNFL